MSINTDIRELQILRKKRQIVAFYDVTKIENNCFMLQRKSFTRIHKICSFDDILSD